VLRIGLSNFQKVDSLSLESAIMLVADCH